MGIFEEIQQYQSEGRGIEEIAQILSQRGYTPQEISDALSQFQIKEAVSGGAQDYSNDLTYSPQEDPSFSGGDYGGESSGGYMGGGYSGLSTDSMSEIAEQTVLEKLVPFRKRLEEVLDLKVSLESRIEIVEQRIDRIEKIIERLELSILQRIGEYVSDVEGIRKEMQESNKTIRSLIEKGLTEKSHSKKTST